MYKVLLTFRYLRRKIIPYLAIIAVTLCVAMLVIVISIMGGFHSLLMGAGTQLMGDVKMETGPEGFVYYEQLIDAIEAMPEAKAAVATIETFGMLQTRGNRNIVVQVVGVDPQKLARVTSYGESIYWTRESLEKHLAESDAAMDGFDQLVEQERALYEKLDGASDSARARIGKKIEDVQDRMRDIRIGRMNLEIIKRYYNGTDPASHAMNFTAPPKHEGDRSADVPPMVVGLEVNPYNRRNDEGKYVIWDPWMGEPMSLTVLPITERGAVVDPKPRVFAAVNEFHTGWYEMDSKRVYVPFDVLQEMLLMGEAELVDPNDPTVVIGTAPARAYGIIVRAVDGVSAEELRDAIAKRYAAFHAAHPDLPPEPFMSIYTWRQKLRNLLDTVENEKNLMTFLFSIVSVVSILLILAIFYMIVLEKTRDIGILRALGASRMGVASIFLVYAGVIGAIGTALGTVIAYFIVTYINELHAWLGRAFGIVIWDRRVYFFENIPSRLDPTEVGVIAVAAVVAAVCGAILPAMMAARVDPVESLRYE